MNMFYLALALIIIVSGGIQLFYEVAGRGDSKNEDRMERIERIKDIINLVGYIAFGIMIVSFLIKEVLKS